MRFDSKQSIAIMGFAGLMAASLSGCGGGGGSVGTVSAAEQQAQVTSFAVPVTKDNVGAIVGQDFKFSSGIEAVDVNGTVVSLPPTTLTVSSSNASPTGYAFTMKFEDGTDVSGEFGFGSCIFTVTKTTTVWQKKNESPPDILTVGKTVEIQACEVGLNGQYTVTDQALFVGEVMTKLGSSITDTKKTPVKVIFKEDKGTVTINGQNVGDTRLEFLKGGGTTNLVTGSTNAGG